MGKQGPCYHCGVTSTPLWRNGPPEKPVLCNACGSRWRTKGSLASYTPLHARAGPDDYEDQRAWKVKSICINKNKEVKLVRKNPAHGNMLVGGIASDYNLVWKNVSDEEISNRSSSGSVISNSESCAQLGSADAGELTGPAELFGRALSVPSKKRTSINRLKQSPFKKLTKDLYAIWQEQQSSCFSGSSEEDLLFDDGKPIFSVEIGHGSVLIRHSNSNLDDESESSSLSVENKQQPANEAYLNAPVPTVQCESKFAGFLQRDTVLHENAQSLETHDSPLRNIDLNDVLNFEVFTRLLMNEEQQELLKYLCPVDTAKNPDSIKNMFDSPEFRGNMLVYQQLLSEGVFDLSFSGAKTEDLKILKRLTLSSQSKCKWVEHYNLIKNYGNDSGTSILQTETNIISLNDIVGSKRPRDNSGQKTPEMKQIKIPKRGFTKATSESKELGPRSLFSSPPNGISSLILDSADLVNESSIKQDLLLEVPSNGFFPQAELLYPTKNFGQLASTSSSSLLPNPMLL